MSVEFTSARAVRSSPGAAQPGVAVDFQFDSTTDGLQIKIVSIIDEHTRECLSGLLVSCGYNFAPGI